jgi:putative FmdB family regulatory protein
MPTYDYECYSCKATKEEHHKANEDPKIICYICNEPMRKVILSAPVMRMSNYDKAGNWCGDSNAILKKDLRNKKK